MTESTLHHDVAGMFAGAARAHHEATGGANPGWAQWYAQHLVDDLNDALGSDLTSDALADWLVDADRRYQEESPSESWPKAYAHWILAERASG